MAMSDPIADMLTRMRNGLSVGQDRVDVPASRIKEAICTVLKQEGYIQDYERLEESGQPVLRIALKYLPDRSPVIQGLRRVSRPSLRIYARCAEIRPVRSGLGLSIVSTAQGVMTSKQARAAHLGGEVLCEVW